MDHRTLLVAAFLAAGVAGLVDSSRAETIATVTGDIAVKESDVATPARGMTMDQVASRFGAPVTKVPAVGKPPISRWEYPGFVVYFEHERVIHSVVASAGAPSTETPATETPATDAPTSPDPAANS
jgi:hypothetical protein